MNKILSFINIRLIVKYLSSLFNLQITMSICILIIIYILYNHNNYEMLSITKSTFDNTNVDRIVLDNGTIDEVSNDYVRLNDLLLDSSINKHSLPDKDTTTTFIGHINRQENESVMTTYQKHKKGNQKPITNSDDFPDKDNSDAYTQEISDKVKSTPNEITDNSIENIQSFNTNQEEVSNVNNHNENVYQKKIYDVSVLMQDKEINSDEAFDNPVKVDNQSITDDEYIVQSIESIDSYDSAKFHMNHMDEIDDTDGE